MRIAAAASRKMDLRRGSPRCRLRFAGCGAEPLAFPGERFISASRDASSQQEADHPSGNGTNGHSMPLSLAAGGAELAMIA